MNFYKEDDAFACLEEAERLVGQMGGRAVGSEVGFIAFL